MLRQGEVSQRQGEARQWVAVGVAAAKRALKFAGNTQLNICDKPHKRLVELAKNDVD